MKNEAGLFSLGWKDVVKGFIMAIISALLTGVYTSINAGTFPPDVAGWKSMGIVALGAGVAYILKNWLSNSDGQFMKKESDAPTK